MKRIDYGNRIIVDELFLIIMVLVLVTVFALFFFGKIVPLQKAAYFVPRSSITTIDGHTVLSIFDSGGDPVFFWNAPQARYRTVVFIDSRSVTFRAVPSESLLVIRPGDTIYAVYTGSGFVLTGTPNDTVLFSLPRGKISVRFVDPVSGIQISREDLEV